MRVAYTNLRVGNLDRSIDFYTKILGMNLHNRIDNKEHQYSLAWLGFSEFCADNTADIELTFNWDTTSYELGNGFGQIVLATDDVYKACDEIKTKGWTFTREPGPVKGGNAVIAFLEDPDGYRIEIVEEFTLEWKF